MSSSSSSARSPAAAVAAADAVLDGARGGGGGGGGGRAIDNGGNLNGSSWNGGAGAVFGNGESTGDNGGDDDLEPLPETLAENIQVVVRVRPLLTHETSGGREAVPIVDLEPADGKSLVVRGAHSRSVGNERVGLAKASTKASWPSCLKARQTLAAYV